MAMAATTAVAMAMVTAHNGCVEGNCVSNAAVAAVTKELRTAVKAAAKWGWQQRLQ